MAELANLSDHTRYIALDCQSQHNTSFFATCCHPLQSYQTLSDRPSYCTPNATESSSASCYTATATTTASADAEASTQYSSASASVASVFSSVASQASSSSLSNADQHAHHSTSTTSSAPAATSTSSSSGGSSSGTQMTGGFATYYTQNGNEGECGQYHSDSDYIIAIDTNGWWPDYQTNSNSPYCGRKITLTNTDNGKSVTATVEDACPSCSTDNSLDLSVAAFLAIADDTSVGEVPIVWEFTS